MLKTLVHFMPMILNGKCNSCGPMWAPNCRELVSKFKLLSKGMRAISDPYSLILK